MITEDKVTEIFCMADDFCKFFDALMARYTIRDTRKRRYHRDSTMSKAEIMLIMILFHDSGYRCLKHFYLEKVCKHLRHLFPKVVSYNRFVELERDVAMPLALFIKKMLLDKCTGISFVDSTPPEGLSQSENTHPQDVQGHRSTWEMFYGVVLWLQATLDMQ